MDETKYHLAAGAGAVVEVDAPAIMVQEVSAAPPASGDGENRGVVISPPALQKVPIFPKHDVKSVAQRLASQPVSNVWGLLTAVSEKARARPQGVQIMLCGLEHILGRMVKEDVYRIESLNVSGSHCTISRRVCDVDGKIQPFNHELSPGDRVMVCIKDSSSNGTFVNQQKLQKNGAEVELQHGDIVSLVGPPEHENAFAFVYRRVPTGTSVLGITLQNDPTDATRAASLKRKNTPSQDVEEGGGAECKRSRGLGTGGPDGPVSLNDVRRLQRSNEELRQQLETNTLATEKLRSNYRASEAAHDAELKEVRASITEKYVTQIEDMRVELSVRAKELEESAAMISHQQSTIEDLKQHLAVAAKSRLDAEEAIESHKGMVQELENRLEDEHTQHSKDKAKAEAKFKADLDRVCNESAEELKHVIEGAALQHKQQQDIILTLQESDKENRLAAENLRKKLDIERAAVVAAEEKGRRLEAQLQEERIHNVNSLNRLAEIEKDLQQACQGLEDEKCAKEVAEGKVAALKLEMEVVFRDLALEKQRLQGARERILLRETQLRAFHSTAAEVATLQQKQQEQLAAMLRTLEDGDDEKMKGEADTPSTSPYTTAIRGSPKCAPERNSVATKDAVEDPQSRFGTLEQVETEAHSSHQRMMGDTSKINANYKSFGDESPTRTDSLHSAADESSKSSSEGGQKMKSPVQQAVYGNAGDKQDWSEGETQEEDCMRYTGFPPAALMDTQIETIPTTTETLVGESTVCHNSVQYLSSNASVLAEAGCTQLMDVEGTQAVWSGNMHAFQAQCKNSLQITGEPETHSAAVMHEARMVDYPNSLHVNCEVPAHGDEHLIRDSKEQENCDAETQKDDDNDIAEKTKLSYDEAYGEDQHRPMIWERTADQLFPKMNTGILEESEDQQVRVSGNSRRVSAEDGCSRMCKGEQQGLVVGRRVLQLNDSPQTETESQSRKEVESSLCTDDLRVSEVVGSWALYTPAATRGHAESSSNDDDADSIADETPRISEEGNQADVAASQVDTNLLERAGTRNPEHQDVVANFPSADANIDGSQTSLIRSSMGNPEIQTLNGFRPSVAEVQTAALIPRNMSGIVPGYDNWSEGEGPSCHMSECREDSEIGNSAETKS